MGKLRGNSQKKKCRKKLSNSGSNKDEERWGRYFRYPMSSVITAIKETVLYIPVYIPRFKEN